MKTLIISVDYPLPEDKGNRMRTMHFVRFFKERGDVDLMCYKSHAPQSLLETPFRKEYYIELNVNNANIGKNIFKTIKEKFIESKPWIVNNFTTDTIKYIHNIIIEENYDVILCRYSVNAYPLLSLPDKYKEKVVLDVDDLMYSELYDVIYGIKKGLVRIKAALDKIIFKKYQIKCMDIGKVVFCSRTDRDKMLKYSKKQNKYIIPNIVPKQTLPKSYNVDGYNNKYMLFVGVLSYKPNEMGIIWFINEIFNKLPKEFDDMKLLVVGKDPQDRLKMICAENCNIELIENPPDVVPYFEKCSLVVVPVLVGGGTRIKILEAGSGYRPVLSTPLGAYGLNLKHHESILFFDSGKSFTENLIWLKNKNNYLTIVNNLKELVDSNYTEQSFNKSLNDLIASASSDNYSV